MLVLSSSSCTRDALRDAMSKKQTSLIGYFQKAAEASSSPAAQPTPVRSSLPCNGLPTPKSPSISHDSESDDVPRVKRRRKVICDDEGSQSEVESTPVKASSLARKLATPSAMTVKPAALTQTTPQTTPAGKTDRESRYEWLLHVRDADGNLPDNPSYDPRTLYIPKSAWQVFTPFEKQFWEIKQKLWDTVVFFKKGKFYELYESDATVGHTLFSLKLTDRVNMRMVGVPESSFEYWCAQFLGAGYKVARVDQKETALGASMRNAKAQVKSKDKLVQRELTCVLTAGTLTDEGLLGGADALYIMAIVEEDRRFGVAFGDASTASFFLAAVEMEEFGTLLAQIRPREVVVEKGGLSKEARKLVKLNTTQETIWNEVLAHEVIAISDHSYWQEVPPALRDVDDECATQAFGRLAWYLKSLNIDRELLSLGNIAVYNPADIKTNLLMDGQTLQNLEIFANSFDGGVKGTLWSFVDRCVTAFGKRLLKDWLCKPLSNVVEIGRRLDMVDMLNADRDARNLLVVQLRKLPDLERLISRVHAGRAKITDFCKCLDGFEDLQNTIHSIQLGGLVGELAAMCPDMSSVIETWQHAFDRVKAVEEQILEPAPGFETEFDASQEKIHGIESQLEQLLKTYRKQFGPKTCFRDIGKDSFLVEIPSTTAPAKGWEQNASTKALKRFSTPETRPLVRRLNEAIEEHNQMCEGMKLRFYQRFDENYTQWKALVHAAAQIDCLLALALTSTALYPAARPNFLQDTRKVIELSEVRHPCAERTEFIENDVRLGGQDANLTLLTGANAAGKSTLLRTTCIAVVLAHIGCYVPATRARMTVVDRIMSRLGANDNIFANQSTFFVELNETKRILEDATPQSLVILDELGRGTSTFDGMAIASAVLWHVATHVGCLGFFATHYATLAKEYALHPEVAAKRMAVEVDEAAKRVSFLYRLEPGVSLKSYGMHVANMCGVNRSIVDRAEEAAQEFEAGSHVQRFEEKKHHISLAVCSEFVWLRRLLVGESYAANELRRVLKAL